MVVFDLEPNLKQGQSVREVKMAFRVTYLLGTSKTTYPTKKTTKAIEYWSEVKFKSVSIPEIFAFPMLQYWDTSQ